MLDEQPDWGVFSALNISFEKHKAEICVCVITCVCHHLTGFCCRSGGVNRVGHCATLAEISRGA